ncbi:hypothetical protein DFAR_2690027 [Desulfarculales bacterium]
MPAEKLFMRKVKEVLLLKHEAGCGNRDIAKNRGIGRTTVSRYLPCRLRIFTRSLTAPRSIKSCGAKA